MKRKRMLNLMVLLFIGMVIHAQNATVVTGGDAKSDEGSVSYTLGQAFTQTVNSESGNLTVGVQQTFNIEVISGIEEANSILLRCKAFPNPTTDYLQLDINGADFNDLSYQLFNSNGQLLACQHVSEQVTTVKMQEYLPAIYLLRVYSNSTQVKTFRIIKK